jgi:hypothetical protein
MWDEHVGAGGQPLDGYAIPIKGPSAHSLLPHLHSNQVFEALAAPSPFKHTFPMHVRTTLLNLCHAPELLQVPFYLREMVHLQRSECKREHSGTAQERHVGGRKIQGVIRYSNTSTSSGC